MWRKLALVAVLGTTTLATTGCVREISQAVNGDYHALSPATGGVYITVKRNATNGMVAVYENCRRSGKGSSTCGTETLRVARGVVEPRLRGRAREVWNGSYSVFGWHPNVGKGFRDGEGGDLATAIADLRRRGDECLRVHWKPSGTNWTTVDDEGVRECTWGASVG